MPLQKEYPSTPHGEAFYKKWKKNYDAAYAKGDPIISDSAYDAFILKFKKYYPNSSALKQVGIALGRSKTKSEIPIVVGSLDLCRPNNLQKWMQTIQKKVPQTRWLIEPKFDGISVTLHYIDGLLKTAWSRGELVQGKSMGYDVTPAAKFVQGVLGRLRSIKVLPLKGEYIVRGEFIMHNSIFKKKYFKKPVSGKPEGYQNARGLCAGLMNRVDISEVKDILKDCTFIALQLFQKTSKGWRRNFNAHSEWVHLTLFGFTTATNPVRYSAGHWKIYKAVKDGHEAIRHVLPVFEQGGTLGDLIYWDSIPTEDEIIERMNSIFSIVDIGCDGIVVQPIDNKVFQLQGEHLAPLPSFIRAVKFEVHDQLTREGLIKEVEWTVSKRGLLKPVLILKKGLEFNGVIVDRCNGINAKNIKLHQLQAGTKVKLCRSGDAIPRLLQVFKQGKWVKVVE